MATTSRPTLPRPIQRPLAKPSAIVPAFYFLDEAAFRSDAHRGTTLGKRGETPVTKDSGGRFGFKLISAVSARGDRHFDVIEGAMDADQFIAFLLKLRSDNSFNSCISMKVHIIPQRSHPKLWKRAAYNSAKRPPKII